MTEAKSRRSENGSSLSSSSSDKDNVGNDALFVIGLHGSGDTIALFLQDWEVAEEVRMPKVPEGCPEVSVREDS